MGEPENLEDICAWKHMQLEEGNSTFRHVKGPEHNLYQCTLCAGGPGACEKYKSHYGLAKKWG